MQRGSLDDRKPNTMQIRLHLNPEGWRGWVAGGWELPQYSYLSPAKLGLGLSLAIFVYGILIYKVVGKSYCLLKLFRVGSGVGKHVVIMLSQP